MAHLFEALKQPIALLGVCILIQGSLPAQQPAAAGGLSITILDGEDAIVNVRQRVSRETIVQVEDENRKPVAGAIVTFTSPSNGPSATFMNGSNTITATTDAQGRVAMRGITPNKSPGKFEIKISASKDGKTATRTITQTNVAGAAAAVSGKTLAILLGIGGAAAAGIAVGLTRGGNNNPPAANPSVVLVPGTPTVGPPR